MSIERCLYWLEGWNDAQLLQICSWKWCDCKFLKIYDVMLKKYNTVTTTNLFRPQETELVLQYASRVHVNQDAQNRSLRRWKLIFILILFKSSQYKLVEKQKQKSTTTISRRFSSVFDFCFCFEKQKHVFAFQKSNCKMSLFLDVFVFENKNKKQKQL